jgi:hypothetical protein
MLPFYAQGRKAIWDGIDGNGKRFIEAFPRELVRDMNEQEMRIEFKNGSAWQVVGSDRIDALVGSNPRGIVFSEFPLHKPETWEFCRPILAENGGWASFNGTPRGMNHAYKMFQYAKSSPEWFWEILTVDDTEAIPKEVLDEERRNMPLDLFEQEYYCKFLDGGSQVFKRIHENLWEGDLPPEPGHTYQVGVDLAKYQDFTVITPFDLSTFRAGRQERFNHIDWNVQKAKIEATSARYNGGRVFLDSTGVGDPIYEDLERQGVPIEGFKFTEISKKQLLENLAILLEQDKIKIPNDSELMDELRGIQWELTDNGKLKIASVTDHDDRVMSLALSVWGVTNPIGVAKKSDAAEGMYAAQEWG